MIKGQGFFVSMSSPHSSLDLLPKPDPSYTRDPPPPKKSHLWIEKVMNKAGWAREEIRTVECNDRNLGVGRGTRQNRTELKGCPGDRVD